MKSEVKNEWISPKEAKIMAEKLMLGGRSAESDEDWVLVIHCWAANFPVEMVEAETILCARIMECPLSDKLIESIIAFQVKKRTS